MLQEVLGRGGMGVLWLAHHRLPEQRTVQGGTVVLKAMHGDLAADPGYRTRFEREAGLGSRLDHPGIVRVLDLVVDSDRLGVVMERIDGQTWAERLARSGPAPWPEALRWTAEAAAALAYAHAAGVLHRDVKPANLMIDAAGRTRLLDFGVARAADERGETLEGGIVGTWDYMAPEQHHSAASTGPRSDLYGLAVSLYELLTGRLPWERDATAVAVLHAKMSGNLVALRGLRPDLPAAVADVVMSGLAPDPADRPESMEAFAKALQDGPRPPAPATEPAPAPPPPAPSRPVAPVARPKRPGAKVGLVVLMGFMAMGLCAAGVGLLIWAPWEPSDSGDPDGGWRPETVEQPMEDAVEEREDPARPPDVVLGEPLGPEDKFTLAEWQTVRTEPRALKTLKAEDVPDPPPGERMFCEGRFPVALSEHGDMTFRDCAYDDPEGFFTITVRVEDTATVGALGTLSLVRVDDECTAGPLMCGNMPVQVDWFLFVESGAKGLASYGRPDALFPDGHIGLGGFTPPKLDVLPSALGHNYVRLSGLGVGPNDWWKNPETPVTALIRYRGDELDVVRVEP